MDSKIKGTICGIISAITYGTNPLGALNLYKEGINVDSVLFYRYGLAVLLLASWMIVRKTSFKITSQEFLICSSLGIMFALSSLSLFSSFHFMDAGIASTILFVYPIMVAVIMAVFFNEKVKLITMLSILIAIVGIGLLYKGGNGATLSLTGVSLVLLSSLTYAVYIITVNKSRISLSPIKMTFYVMLFGVVAIVAHSFYGQENNIQLLTTRTAWGWVLMLAFLPTIISLVLMVIAVREIGSTPTAIMGALEPVTAVIIGVLVFSEPFSLRMLTGILLILSAVLLIVGGKTIKIREKIRLYPLRRK